MLNCFICQQFSWYDNPNHSGIVNILQTWMYEKCDSLTKFTKLNIWHLFGSQNNSLTQTSSTSFVSKHQLELRERKKVVHIRLISYIHLSLHSYSQCSSCTLCFASLLMNSTTVRTNQLLPNSHAVISQFHWFWAATKKGVK